MFTNRKKQNKKRVRYSSTTGTDFRRNSVVISRKQREMEAHKQSVTQRQIDKKKQLRRKTIKNQLFLVFFISLIIIAALRYQITNISVSSKGKTSVSLSEQLSYQSSILKYTDSHALLKQSWLTDKAALVNYIKRNFPEVRSVEIMMRQPISTTTSVKLSYRKPIFIWKGVGDSQFIDKEGVLFSKNLYKDLKLSTLPVIEDRGGAAPDPGQTILSHTVVKDVADIHKYIPKVYTNDTKVNKLILPPAAREIRVELKGVGYTIKLSTERTISSQAGELKQIASYLKQSNIEPKEYIDIRVANKAFYK